MIKQNIYNRLIFLLLIIFVFSVSTGCFLWQEYYFFTQKNQEMLVYKKLYKELAIRYCYELEQLQKKSDFVLTSGSGGHENAMDGIGRNSCSEETLHAEAKKNSSLRTKWVMPIDASLYRISSRYGARKRKNGTWGFHYGIDMASARGTPVKAAAAGKVVEAGYSTKGYGKTILIAHKNIGFQTRYAHLDKILVNRNQEVKSGQKIGLVGATGFVISENGSNDASHLHFEVKKGEKHIDPLRILT